MRQTVTLVYAETGEHLHLTSKNRQSTPEKLQLKKYSPELQHRALFTEVK